MEWQQPEKNESLTATLKKAKKEILFWPFPFKNYCSILITNHSATASTLAITSAGGDTAGVVLPTPTTGRVSAQGVARAPPIALAGVAGGDTTTAGNDGCAATATTAARYCTGRCNGATGGGVNAAGA